MPCTVKKTCEVAYETGSDVLVQVKGNQPTLEKRLMDYANLNRETDSHVSIEIGKRNRHEERIVRVWSLRKDVFEEESPWCMGKTLIEVTRTTDCFNTKTKAWDQRKEKSLYWCTRTVDAKQGGHWVREHWSIENRNHYVRDKTLKEDASRIRRSPSIFARLRSWTLNILRFNKESNIEQALYQNTLDFNRVLNYKALF
jgi:predicted transposase YbfD/YdcC